ncbi:histidinol dehydrogenase [Paraburkholderia sp. C35]|uniref:histidinol dehydrogenase n=1 Tax=Paraburkholderia sp. C35 TaxID=2126993 RepID=UPI001EF486EF|nr:histidinol dehydrogenase [Paraburkholderia sp. C35]
MAIQYLKNGRSVEDSTQDAAKVRDVVTGILADVASRGDMAVAELSAKFDNWSPERFRLSEDEIASCVRSLSQGQLEDIKFAQAQVRNFAQAQRESIRDVEVETMPGVVLGHKNMPVDSVACYVPGGKFPLVASAHMGVVTAKVAGVPRIITASPPVGGKPNPAVVAAMHLGYVHEIYNIVRVQAL